MSLLGETERDEIGQFFELHRICRGESRTIVAMRLLELIKQKSPSDPADSSMKKWSLARRLEIMQVGSVATFLALFETHAHHRRIGTRGQKILRDDVKTLTKAYEVAPEIADSFLIRRNPHFVIGAIEDFKTAPGGADGVDYQLPTRRLQNSDVSIAIVRLAPGKSTVSHQHAGDELIYVLEGKMVVEFENTGSQINLGRGDSVQFYAERPHRGVGVDEPGNNVVALVLRFFQFRCTGHRTAIRLHLLPRSGQPSHFIKPNETLLEMETAWLVTFDHIRRNDIGTRILDYHGMTRLVTRMCSAEYQGAARRRWVADQTTDVAAAGQFPSHRTAISAADLANRAKVLAARTAEGSVERHFFQKCVETFFSNLQTGAWGRWQFETMLRNKKEQNNLTLTEAGLDRDFIRLLAQILGNREDVEPMLFYDFLYPAERGAIVLRQSDWETIPEPFIPEGVTYCIPKRRLALSDIAIIKLGFEPITRSPNSTHENRHPGTELCVCLKGEITVELALSEKKKRKFRIPEGYFIHFNSSLYHSVKNIKCNPAEVLVVRFYESPSPRMATPKKRR